MASVAGRSGGIDCHPPRVCSDELDPTEASPAGLTTANRMFPICVHLNGRKSGTPDFGVKPGNDSKWCINFIGTCSSACSGELDPSQVSPAGLTRGSILFT